MEATTPGTPAAVGLSLEAPGQARRATVAFRLILAIPHFIFAFALSFAAMVTSLVGWVAAVFTGRLPEGIADFLGGIVRYNTRLYGYLYLLTDQYPPFSIDAVDYPIAVTLPERGRLNRFAVLFRLVLAIPAALLISVIGSGLQLSLVVIWLIVLVSGRMPRPAFEAEAAALRYQTRFYAWFLMLTTEYPRGLFGDPTIATPPLMPPPAAAPAAAEPTGPARTYRLRAEPLSAIPAPPPPPTDAGWSPAPEGSTAAPRITSLVLSKGGRRLLGVFLALGIVLSIGQIAVAFTAGFQTSEAQRDLDRAYTVVVDASLDYGATVQTCGISGGAECVHAADRDLAAALRRFDDELGDIDFPASALADADALRQDARLLAETLDQMAVTSDATAYEGLALQFQIRANELDQDYVDLHDLLLFG